MNMVVYVAGIHHKPIDSTMENATVICSPMENATVTSRLAVPQNLELVDWQSLQTLHYSVSLSKRCLSALDSP